MEMAEETQKNDRATNACSLRKRQYERIYPEGDLSFAIRAVLALTCRRMRKAGAVLMPAVFGAIIVAHTSASATEASSTATDAPRKMASTGPPSEKVVDSPKMSYIGGQLTINAFNSSWADILRGVAALIGVKIDLPANMDGDHLPAVKYGPGPAREVLASLLRESHLNYLIQASDADPDKIQSVFIVSTEQDSSRTEGKDGIPAPARPGDQRAIDPAHESDQASVTDSPAEAPEQNTAADVSSPNSQAGPIEPEQSASQLSAQANQSHATKVAPLSPPEIMTPENINQQLHQMYQQRVQMIQQDRQTTAPTHPTGPGIN